MLSAGQGLGMLEPLSSRLPAMGISSHHAAKAMPKSEYDLGPTLNPYLDPLSSKYPWLPITNPTQYPEKRGERFCRNDSTPSLKSRVAPATF
jgi:hypothetical protein